MPKAHELQSTLSIVEQGHIECRHRILCGGYIIRVLQSPSIGPLRCWLSRNIGRNSYASR